MKANVIIPAFNAQRTIKNLLESLISQDYPKEDYEVIVVDDGSTDATVRIVKDYSVTYLFQKNKGAGAARNLGAKKAKGKIFIFVDSDCLVSQDWLKNYWQAYQENPQAGIIGGGVRKPKKRNYLAWADYLSSWHNAHECLPRHWVKEYLPSLNLSVRGEVFKRVGGFWEKKLTGEDVDFCSRARKIGTGILFEPRLAVWHKNPSLAGFFKHNFNWGHHASFVRGSEEGLEFHPLFSGSFGKSLLMFLPIVLGWPLFLALSWWRYQPLRFLICLPLIFLGRFAYGLGFLAGVWQKSFGGKK